jgi:Acetyltransferase (GNAT) domain
VSAVEARVLEPGDYERWSAFVRAAPSGSAYSLPAYLEALCRATGDRFDVLGAWRGDELVGGIGVYERRSPLGPFVGPRLLLQYNGFVLREYETRYPSDRAARQAAALAALGDALADRAYGRLEVRSRGPVDDLRPLLARGWDADPSYTYVVPLADLDAQWQRVEQNQRRLVERARQQGLTVTDDGDFDAFFSLHTSTAERKGALLYLPRDAFQRFYDDLRASDLCRLFEARLPDGRLAAAQLVLLGHPVTHTVAAAADRELQSTGANPFLRWSVFERLAAEGYAANDLTDAMNPQVARFKAQLGGELELFLAARRPPSLRFRTASRAQELAVRARAIGERSS